MGEIVKPEHDCLKKLVAPFLKAQPKGLGFAIGYAGTGFAGPDCIFYDGDIHDQFGAHIDLNRNTPFEIASISKTFTATLYALLIRASDPKQKAGDYISPKCLPISPTLANITLDQLVNYTSGFPKDYDEDGANATTPRLPPRPYSLEAFLSYLETKPPLVSPKEKYTYSNLAFALMSAILAAGLTKEKPTVAAFVKQMRDHIFTPLHMDDTKYFDEVSLVGFPRGYDYSYKHDPPYKDMQAGHPFFPAYFGEAGIVTTPNDLYKWLLFNMGITKHEQLTPLLPVLQTPLTNTLDDDGEQLGLGWFIDPKGDTWPASIRKDGELDGFQSFIEFLPSLDPLNTPSQAGVFVLVNASRINAEQQFGENTTLAAGLANKVLGIMLGG